MNPRKQKSHRKWFHYENEMLRQEYEELFTNASEHLESNISNFKFIIDFLFADITNGEKKFNRHGYLSSLFL